MLTYISSSTLAPQAKYAKRLLFTSWVACVFCYSLQLLQHLITAQADNSTTSTDSY